jgi:hypothetical protein
MNWSKINNSSLKVEIYDSEEEEKIYDEYGHKIGNN